MTHRSCVTLRDWIDELASADTEQKRELLAQIAASGDDNSDSVFEAFARGALYLDRRSSSVVIAQRTGSKYLLSDVLTGEDLGSAGRRDVRRIAIDNSLRSELQNLQSIARLSYPNAR